MSSPETGAAAAASELEAPAAVPADPGAWEQSLEDAHFNAEKAEWEDSDPGTVSNTQPETNWDPAVERQARDLAAQGKTEEAEALLAEAAPEPEAEVEAEKPATETPEPEVVAAPPAPDRIDRLAELVEKLVTPRQEVKAEPAKIDPVEAANADVTRFETDPDFRVDILKRLGYTRPEHLEDPHAYRVAERALLDRVEKAERQRDREELAAFRAERAAEKAAQAAELRDRQTSEAFAKSLEAFGAVPTKTRTALEGAVKAAVAQGHTAEAAIKVVLDTFGEILPKKAAAPAPAPKKTIDPKQAARDRAIASPTRAANRPRNLTEELRSLERGRGWS